MTNKITKIRHRIKSGFNQEGAVAFEYVLIIGAVSTVIVLAIAVGAPSLFHSVLDSTCTAVNGIVSATVDCAAGAHNHPEQPGHPGHGIPG